MEFAYISRITHAGKSLKFCMLMYLDYLQNFFFHCHSLLIYIILVLFSLGETGKILVFLATSGECVGVNVDGERRHIWDALRRVMYSLYKITL